MRSIMWRIKEAVKLITTGKTTKERELEGDIRGIIGIVQQTTGMSIVRIAMKEQYRIDNGGQFPDPHNCEGVTCLSCYKARKA